MQFLIQPQQYDQLNFNMIEISQDSVDNFSTSYHDENTNTIVVRAGNTNSLFESLENYIQKSIDLDDENFTNYTFTVYPPYYPIYNTLNYIIKGATLDYSGALNVMISQLEATQNEPHGDRALAAGQYIVKVYEDMIRTEEQS